MLEDKWNEIKTKAIEIYGKEKCENINEREKQVNNNTRSIDKNDRKVKNVSLEISEVNSFLISKQNIQTFLTKEFVF